MSESEPLSAEEDPDYPCPECDDQGWVVEAAHARDAECYADRHTNCPVAEQVQCSTCGGRR